MPVVPKVYSIKNEAVSSTPRPPGGTVEVRSNKWEPVTGVSFLQHEITLEEDANVQFNFSFITSNTEAKTSDRQGTAITAWFFLESTVVDDKYFGDSPTAIQHVYKGQTRSWGVVAATNLAAGTYNLEVQFQPSDPASSFEVSGNVVYVIAEYDNTIEDYNGFFEEV